MFKIYLMAAALLIPISSQATTSSVLWTFSNNSNCVDGGSGSCNTAQSGGYNFGSVQKFSSATDSVGVTVNAWSTTGGTGQDTSNSETSNTDVDGFAAGTLSSWSGGLGVFSAEDGSFSNTPDHAFDNDGGPIVNGVDAADEKPDGDVDAAVFKFDKEITLTSLSIGYRDTDADISVLAYTGTNGTPEQTDANGITTLNLANLTLAELISKGWQFIGHYADLPTTNNPSVTASTAGKGFNSSNVKSSYWLVTAFSSCADGNCTDTSPSNLTFGNDFFKISALSGTYEQGCTGPSCNGGSVPEPSSIFLLALGIVGIYLNRNKYQFTLTNQNTFSA